MVLFTIVILHAFGIHKIHGSDCPKVCNIVAGCCTTMASECSPTIFFGHFVGGRCSLRGLFNVLQKCACTKNSLTRSEIFIVLFGRSVKIMWQLIVVIIEVMVVEKLGRMAN